MIDIDCLTYAERRKFLALIRNDNVEPNFMLPNGYTAGQFALMYMIQNNMRRSLKKKRKKKKS